MKEQIEEREKRTSARNDRGTQRDRERKQKWREREKEANRKSTIRG